MRSVLYVVLMAGVLLLGCTPRTPPLPDRGVETVGQAAAQRFMNGEFYASLRLYIKAYNEAARYDIVALEARYQFNIGRILYECMRFDSSCGYFSRSADLSLRIGAEADAAVATVYSALSYAYLGETDTAHRLFDSVSGKCAPQDSVTVRIAGVLLQLLSGKTADARRSADLLLGDLRGNDDELSLGTVYSYKAMAVFSEGDADGAQQLLDSSLAAFGRSPYRFRNWRSLEGKAILSYCMHDSVAGEQWHERAKRAAPDFVRLPDASVLRECPTSW